MFTIVYTRILAASHISRPLKISVKIVISDKCKNDIIVMRVSADPTISAFIFYMLRSANMRVYTGNQHCC